MKNANINAVAVAVSDNDVMAELEALRAENARLKAASEKKSRLYCKVSAKGAVSVYGLGRFPVTLYKSQMEALLKFVPEIESFISANAGALSVKSDAEAKADD